MKSDKKIAIIGSGEMAVILVENADRMGIETHTFSSDLHDRVVGVSDEHHDISIFDTERIISICREIGIRGVLPTTELTVSIAAIVSEALGLPGMPVEVSRKVTDKGFVRRMAEGIENLNQPEYEIWTIGDRIPTIKTFPVVVKPTSLGGKRGVSVARNEDEFRRALEYSIGSMPPTKKEIIIEQFIGGGKEYSVESLSCKGRHMVIQVTEKITSGPPHCVELGHLQPAELSAELRKKVEETIPRLLEKVGVDNTTTHTEIKIVDGKIYLIELNARSGGDHIAYPLTELSTGYPYIQGAINVAMGTFGFPSPERFRRNHCGVFFITEQTRDFEPLFRNCSRYDWLYRKNEKTTDLQELVFNQAFDTNYFIFRAEDRIPEEIAEVLRGRGII